MNHKNHSRQLAGTLTWRQAGIIAACSLIGLLCFQNASPVIAQTQISQQYPQQQKRRTLLDMLFGNSRQPERQQIIEQPVRQPMRRNIAPVKKKPVISKPKSAVITPAQPSQPEAQAKNPDAKKILVIGDFIAGGLAEGLSETFAQAPDLQIINHTNGSSGFVRQDYYNWSKELPAILAEQKPAAIVMMIGANDRQSLTGKGVTVAPDTDSWKELYQSRVDEFLQDVTKSGIPLVWIGQPPYKFPALSQTMLSLNALYKTTTEQVGISPDATVASAHFIDVWDGFVDDKGSFTQTGVDINGQTVRLRGNDGITMTAAGKRKLAFYAEKPLRQLLKLSSPEHPTSDRTTADLKSNERMAAPVHKEIVRIGPIKLSDLDQSGDDNLLGEAAITGKSPTTRTGAKQAPQGRADDFRWPRP